MSDADNPQPTIVDQAAAAAAAPAAGASAPAPGQQERPPLGVTSIVEVTDKDEIELRDALAAEAEEAAAKNPDGSTGVTDGDATRTPPVATHGSKQPPAPADAPMIPKARLDEVLGRAGKAETEAAYWRGVAEARAPQPGQPGAGQQPPAAAEPTQEQRLAEIHTQLDAVATKYDDGEITYADLKKQERELQAKERAVLNEAPKNAPAPARNDDLYLEDMTQKIEQEHPWLDGFAKVGSDLDWSYIEQTARQRLADRGVSLKGNVGTYNLRKELGRVADELGPGLLTARLNAKKLPLPGQPAAPGQPQPPRPPLSPAAKARLDNLDRQGLAPPDLAAMQGGGPDGAGVPDSSIEHMSDEQIAALPKSTLDRVLGTTR